MADCYGVGGHYLNSKEAIFIGKIIGCFAGVGNGNAIKGLFILVKEPDPDLFLLCKYRKAHYKADSRTNNSLEHTCILKFFHFGGKIAVSAEINRCFYKLS